MQIVFIVLISTLITACSLSNKPTQSVEAAKIKFPLDTPDGHSIAYEFCVPAEEKVYQSIRQIDPTVKILEGSHGRIGCSKGTTLCVGETIQPHWRSVLKKLASLDYITEIQRCYFE